MTVRGARRRIRILSERIRNRWARVNPAPLFVLGNPKSGTTAVAALLARRTGLSVTLDIPALFGYAVSSISSGERQFVDAVYENRLAFSRDVVKHGSLAFIYPQVREVFPHSQYVMVMRDPRANIRSTLDRLGLGGRHQEISPDEVAALPEPWQAALDPRSMDLPSGNYVETLARRWCLAADAYLNNRAEMLLVRYEDFVRDREGVIDELVAQLELRPTHGISDWTTRQFQPAGRNRGVPWLEFYGRENLVELERICGPDMLRLGYALGAEPRARVSGG
jgi:hypothetical protein